MSLHSQGTTTKTTEALEILYKACERDNKNPQVVVVVVVVVVGVFVCLFVVVVIVVVVVVFNFCCLVIFPEGAHINVSGRVLQVQQHQ